MVKENIFINQKILLLSRLNRAGPLKIKFQFIFLFVVVIQCSEKVFARNISRSHLVLNELFLILSEFPYVECIHSSIMLISSLLIVFQKLLTFSLK